VLQSSQRFLRTWSLLLVTAIAIPSIGAIGVAPSAAGMRPLVIVVMENHERSDIVGSSSAPYLNGLRSRGIDFTNYVGVTHPSLPNYLALASGSTAGKSGSDSIRAGEISGMATIWNQLQNNGIGWRVYEESMPSTCYGGTSSGGYVLRHNPSIPFSAVFQSSTACGHVQRYAPGVPLAPVTFITPNLCHDMHDCSIATGDSWLKANLQPIIQAGATVVITFDEGDSSTGGGGNIYTVVAGSGVTHRVNAYRYDHYSLLAAIEHRFGLPLLRNAASAPRLPLS
jgi:phosphatidylinositol-3-phosphatase